MTRALNAAMLADIALQSAEKTELLELQFAQGTVRLCTASHDLLWNGFTWEALGGTLEVEGFGESTDEMNDGCRIRLSGVEQTIVALVLGASHRGRKAVCYYAHLSPVTGQFIANPVTMFDGFMNESFSVEETWTPEGSGSAEISTKLTARVSELIKRRGVRTNMHSHQAEIPGASADTFFKHVPTLMGKRIYWGIRSPHNGPPPVIPPANPLTQNPPGTGGGGIGPYGGGAGNPWGGTPNNNPWNNPGIGNMPSAPTPNMDPGRTG